MSIFNFNISSFFAFFSTSLVCLIISICGLSLSIMVACFLVIFERNSWTPVANIFLTCKTSLRKSSRMGK
eukprot:05214.XXX_265171_265380_1 [CDS] Oithona nana genome sequencing.